MAKKSQMQHNYTFKKRSIKYQLINCVQPNKEKTTMSRIYNRGIGFIRKETLLL